MIGACLNAGSGYVIYRLSAVIYRLSAVIYRLSAVIYRLSAVNSFSQKTIS